MEMYEIAYRATTEGPAIRRQYEDFADAWAAYNDSSLERCTLYKLEDGERHVLCMKIWRGRE